MKKRSFIKKYLGSYARYNHGKTGKQAKRKRKIGKHIIRSKLKMELLEMLEDMNVVVE